MLEKKTIIKLGNTVVVTVDGVTFKRDSLTDEEYLTLVKAEDIKDILKVMEPEYKDKIEERDKIQYFLNEVNNSKILTKEDDCIYWEDISHLSLPIEFVEAVLSAEKFNDDIKLEAYKNFWTLMSLNPNEECRKNLFWFLNSHHLVIARCGFFVAYRNVDKTSEEGIFTDHHTHKFKIKIGEMVTMPREKCDCNPNQLCSRGLHAANNDWLKQNYYGDVGIIVLINPAEVVAVPHESSYGKLRTCAYLPIDFTKYDKEGNVIPYNAKDGFECEYVPKVIYEGIMGTEEDSDYKLVIPDIPELNKKKITDKLLDLARETIINREV